MASFIPIDVDLNKLFEAKLTYGFDPLKEAIAGLLKNQELQNKVLHDLAEEQKDNAKYRSEYEDLKKQLKDHERRITSLEDKCKDYDDKINNLQKQLDQHSSKIAGLEKQIADTKPAADRSHNVVNVTQQITNDRDPNKEIEMELKHLFERIKSAETTMNSLIRKRGDGASTAPTVETNDDEDDELREGLENQIQGIKTRLSRVEDSNDELKREMGKLSKDGSTQTSVASDVDNEIQALKQKIKEIEDRLRELRSRNATPAHVSTKRIPDDNSSQISSIFERLETLESSYEKVTEKLGDHDDRIDKLEKDNEANKSKISSNKQDIGELKDQMSDKVGCDTFDEEINFLKEMLNNLSSGDKVDVQIPAPKPSISTKDANKMKEIMQRLPEIEKLLNELLDRMNRAEKSIGDHDKRLKGHDKLIEEILAELAIKANAKDLKSLLDRVSQLERDIENLIQHMNNIGKSGGSGQAAPVLIDNSDKRLTALEKKIEELRNDLNNSLRDVSKTIDALNSELKGAKKDIDEVKKDLLKLMKKVNDLELKLDALIKLSGAPAVAATISSSPVDEDKLEELRRALNELKNDFRGFRSDVLDKFSNVDSQIDKKADKEDLERLKNLLNKRIDDLENALNKTKNDLKRALRILNDKISKGVETVGPREEREDAMFAKKPLQGWSCASCEKNLVNLQGLPADYYNWKKMPKSKDRIPMMGQGFSRMLQSISNEYAGNMSSTPLKTTYGNGFKDLESANSQRSASKYRPSSSDKKNLNIDDIETDAASKLLPSIKDANRS